MAQITAAEIAFNAASDALTVARNALVRSKSAKNRAAYIQASNAYDATLAVFHAEQAADTVADLRARRLAVVAPRRALLARQFAFAL